MTLECSHLSSRHKPDSLRRQSSPGITKGQNSRRCLWSQPVWSNSCSSRVGGPSCGQSPNSPDRTLDYLGRLHQYLKYLENHIHSGLLYFYS